MVDHIWNSSKAICGGDNGGGLEALGKASSSDKIVEPKRAPLIPELMEVKEAALRAVSYGCTISGAGLTAVGITDENERGRKIGEKMVDAFLLDSGLKAKIVASCLDRVGARVVKN